MKCRCEFGLAEMQMACTEKAAERIEMRCVEIWIDDDIGSIGIVAIAVSISTPSFPEPKQYRQTLWYTNFRLFVVTAGAVLSDRPSLIDRHETQMWRGSA